ncbi:NADP-dependent malic enzyme [Ectothiorhodospiraceae bacterium WFHF3C12]|nr:NADP-dependent malic enzyme [Ectothiorhodospiraceae bacterium WFHF3C12]
MADDFKKSALEYHRLPTPGKISVDPTKPLANQRDLALAYSPGVAAACEAIVDDPRDAALYTARSNLVGVITNGTAVLGLGAIGPLAAKPVMEGKGVLFKKFAGIDVFDIEIDERDPDKLVEIIASLEPTFGAINLEDIKAPECFEVERRLQDEMGIPVFHDDQHGTAIIVAAAITNALTLVDKRLSDVRMVVSGAGAAALACLDLLVSMGARRENITVTDIHGVVYQGRAEAMDPRKAVYARETEARTLAEVIDGADIFLGLSAPRVLKPELLKGMARDPLILALANPVPEILPEEAREARPDAIIATGRSDYPNQVNNVLCFPFIFRGALDVGATDINDAMKKACVQAIADLARAEASDTVAAAYAGQSLEFGRDYIIPKPFDPRLIMQVAPAVAQAAMDSGVATLPLADMNAYRLRLSQYVYESGLLMKPLFERARSETTRVVYADGEDDRVLRAAQVVLDEGLARPIVIGRRRVIEVRLRRLGLRMRLDEDLQLVDPQDDPGFRDYWRFYHKLMQRRGVTPARARQIVRTRSNVIAALMVRRGDAEAMLGSQEGRYHGQLEYIDPIIERREGVRTLAAMNAVVTPKGTLFLCDTYVNQDPTAAQIAEMTVMAADAVRRFGITPKVALLSHANFGASTQPSARKMAEALELIVARAPDLEVEGEMTGDVALDEQVRKRIFPESRLHGAANLVILPSLDAANIAFNLVKTVTSSVSVGPILLGTARSAHILTPSVTVRGIVNMTAVCAVENALKREVTEGKAG